MERCSGLNGFAIRPSRSIKYLALVWSTTTDSSAKQLSRGQLTTRCCLRLSDAEVTTAVLRLSAVFNRLDMVHHSVARLPRATFVELPCELPFLDDLLFSHAANQAGILIACRLPLSIASVVHLGIICVSREVLSLV